MALASMLTAEPILCVGLMASGSSVLGSDAVWLLLLVRRTLALEIQLTKLLFKESKEFRV